MYAEEAENLLSDLHWFRVSVRWSKNIELFPAHSTSDARAIASFRREKWMKDEKCSHDDLIESICQISRLCEYDRVDKGLSWCSQLLISPFHGFLTHSLIQREYLVLFTWDILLIFMWMNAIWNKFPDVLLSSRVVRPFCSDIFINFLLTLAFCLRTCSTTCDSTDSNVCNWGGERNVCFSQTHKRDAILKFSFASIFSSVWSRSRWVAWAGGVWEVQINRQWIWLLRHCWGAQIFHHWICRVSHPHRK